MGYTIPSKYKNTLDRAFDTDNVRVENGTAELTVQDRNGRMTSGSFGTRRADILYGSFRAVMKITDEPGTVGAFYFFRDNKHELDIELLSRNKHPWQAYFAAHPQIYNQDGSASQLTHGKYVLDNDLSSDYHEYRIDWLPNRAEFFVDGQKAHEFTTNVPDLPGRMLVNHWTDGNPNFSGGPPTKPATLSVKSLTYYFNTESDPAPSTNCPPTSCETSGKWYVCCP
ncbi:concanavalin A-like lectin/glucanase domain-containing protein [Radiomyces spectabilis]|uniref:concanavalin A-like lectin/glucanase domain-containing protein n=1 Tax=Radiomyces spectabilis TaxID=64574 RepID=UPI00222011CA|nr:concanavalin A-like lectin/glucanase domain-containing protein [Radiomyces spectabilis]KAI8372917.1 concanavalin A-like lectin/glucanase domain-containing protein [Radiomyces spectabilis]